GPDAEPVVETEFSRSFSPPARSDDWTEQLELPKTVKYTVRFGGSLVRVANLFKIFHHEIQALNPGVDPERELPPGTKVVVYKGEGVSGEGGESVDFAGAGSISDPGGIPMVEGPGRIPKATPWKTFAVAETVAALDLALRRWAKRPGAQKVLVGNLSQRGGGRLKPHSTHQSGRDVDIGYIQKWDGKEELNWRTMNAQNLDPGETWALLQTFVGTGAVEVIFIDRALQKLLFDYARAQGVTEAALEPWMEYPQRTGEGAPMIQHVAGHDDHIHVRFQCPPGHTRCKSRERD
ncbi:MAG: penicillin-insensitive murein endopeptidase, partial [Myxococcales bacterium]|nr:penicillin-insensitive murein endopeptidase [Myxococcales bacterium]